MDKDTREWKPKWKDAPEAALIKVLPVGDGAVVVVFRQPDGSWTAELHLKPVQVQNLSEAMQAGESLARQWQRGLQ